MATQVVHCWLSFGMFTVSLSWVYYCLMVSSICAPFELPIFYGLSLHMLLTTGILAVHCPLTIYCHCLMWFYDIHSSSKCLYIYIYCNVVSIEYPGLSLCNIPYCFAVFLSNVRQGNPKIPLDLIVP